MSLFNPENLGYTLYMMENEGLLDTKRSRKVRMLKDIARRSANGQYELTINDTYLAKFNLKMEDLTDQDYANMAVVAERGRY